MLSERRRERGWEIAAMLDTPRHSGAAPNKKKPHAWRYCPSSRRSGGPGSPPSPVCGSAECPRITLGARRQMAHLLGATGAGNGEHLIAFYAGTTDVLRVWRLSHKLRSATPLNHWLAFAAFRTLLKERSLGRRGRMAIREKPSSTCLSTLSAARAHRREFR